MARVRAAAEPVTRITLDLGQGGRIYDGVGGVLGGGGNARYLMDYPAAQRQQILKYLFKPDYGASLQILKLEIGGDADTTDGAEPSIEHTRGHINCHAGYELAIAKQAVRLNPGLRLYGLQWAAPGWVGQSAAAASPRATSTTCWTGWAAPGAGPADRLPGRLERVRLGSAPELVEIAACGAGPARLPPGAARRAGLHRRG